MSLFFYILLNVKAKDLFYIKLSSSEHDGFLADDALESPLTITKDQEKAKKFWITKDPLDNHKAMLHAMIDGQDVVTRKGNSELVYKRISKDLEKNQYWSILMWAVLRENKEFTRIMNFLLIICIGHMTKAIFFWKKRMNQVRKIKLLKLFMQMVIEILIHLKLELSDVENEGAITNRSFTDSGSNGNFNNNPYYYSPGFNNTAFGSNRAYANSRNYGHPYADKNFGYGNNNFQNEYNNHLTYF
ncbi:hypothetical protein GVAV_002074 [Gurleya vavrai]